MTTQPPIDHPVYKLGAEAIKACFGEDADYAYLDYGNLQALVFKAIEIYEQQREISDIDIVEKMLWAYRNHCREIPPYGAMKAVLEAIRPYLRTTEPKPCKCDPHGFVDMGCPHCKWRTPKPVMIEVVKNHPSAAHLPISVIKHVLDAAGIPNVG